MKGWPNQPQRSAQDGCDDQPWQAEEVQQVVNDEEGDELVVVVDQTKALRVARPVGGVDGQAGDDGAPSQDPQQRDGDHQSPAIVFISYV